MKSVDELSAEKLRGAYYTPPSVVDFCLVQILNLVHCTKDLSILEPSAGDGNFVEGIGRFSKRGVFQNSRLTCVEIDAIAAAKCAERLHTSRVRGSIFCDSFFNWAGGDKQKYDVAIGNPPYIRYQFVSEQERISSELLLRSYGYDLHGVSNFWIAFVLLSIELLKDQGAFAFVIPSEFLATISASQIRNALIRKCKSVHVDFFPRDTFSDILQDVTIVSGIRSLSYSKKGDVEFSEHKPTVIERWCHSVADDGESWTKFLLTNRQWEAYNRLNSLQSFYPFKKLARISVSTVTGANDYFAIDEANRKLFDLHQWCRPLLSKTSDCDGISIVKLDTDKARHEGRKSWLLDFSSDKPDPQLYEKPNEYLQEGVKSGLPGRYKCKIRTPWFRVPVVPPGSLLMPKRAHQHPRLILNGESVVTTDTIYRGQMKEEFVGREMDLVAGFHNSATMLSAEVEGRTYGGGVLELVPSEIARLVVPLYPIGDMLRTLDQTSRLSGGQKDETDTLITATDNLLKTKSDQFAEISAEIQAARNRLRERRFRQ